MTDVERDAMLKRRFEGGLYSLEMIQFIRLHAVHDSVAVTVQKARHFADFAGQTKPKKSLRLMMSQKLDNSATIQRTQTNPEFEPLLDGFSCILLEFLGGFSNSQPNATLHSPNSLTFPSNRSPAVRGGSLHRRFPSSVSGNSRRGPISFQRGRRVNHGDSDTGYIPRLDRPHGGFGETRTRFGQPDQGTVRRWSRPGHRQIDVHRVPPSPLMLRAAFTAVAHTGGPPAHPGGANRSVAGRSVGCYVCGEGGCHSDFHAPRLSPPASQAALRPPSLPQAGALVQREQATRPLHPHRETGLGVRDRALRLQISHYARPSDYNINVAQCSSGRRACSVFSCR